VIFDSAFIKLCFCVIKSNFLSWVIRPVFTDPVTFMHTNMGMKGACSERYASV